DELRSVLRRRNVLRIARLFRVELRARIVLRYNGREREPGSLKDVRYVLVLRGGYFFVVYSYPQNVRRIPALRRIVVPPVLLAAHVETALKYQLRLFAARNVVDAL